MICWYKCSNFLQQMFFSGENIYMQSVVMAIIHPSIRTFRWKAAGVPSRLLSNFLALMVHYGLFRFVGLYVIFLAIV